MFSLQSHPYEDDNPQFITSRVNQFHRSLSSESDITLGRDEGLEGSTGLFDDEIVDLTKVDAAVVRPGLLKDGESSLEAYNLPSGQVIRRGEFVQVRNMHLGGHTIDFVLIEIIAQNYFRSIKIRGTPFVRTRKLQGKLPRKLNEVCMILHVQRRGGLVDSPAMLVDVSPASIVKRRTLIITNATFPTHSYDMESLRHRVGNNKRLRRLAKLSGNLFCRWKFKIYFTLRGQSRTTKPDEEVLERIQSEDVVDSDFCVPDDALCNQWRGGRVKGGSWPSGESSSINLENDAPEQTHRNSEQKYTLFDSFSGAGGVSRGAQMAGFKVQHGLDKWKDVWETYGENFRDTELFKTSVDGFIKASENRRIRVDVLHLSPPCQFFSPAHTHESAHDDENIFALFGCNQLIDKVRPRIITLEQTFGITHDRHHQYLRALIGDYTQFGYSVRWKVVRLCTWGSAQDRKRLIVIASAPGERLPPFPQPTHSEHGGHGLQKFTTIRQALSGIRPGDNLHDLHVVKHYRPPRAPLDPDRLSGTITTGGSEAYYPDGTRDFTLREYASLQGFPKSHKFIGTKTCIKRQIGNAFPPNTVRVLYKHLENWLLNQDGMTRYCPSQEPVVIADDINSESSMPSAGFSTVALSPEMDDVMELEELENSWSRFRVRPRGEVIDLT